MKIFKPLLIALTFCLLGTLIPITPIVGVRFTISPSLPYKFFISRPFTHPVKYQYVSLTHPKSDILLAKQIIGVPGDYISVKNDNLCINELAYGLILKTSKSGTQYHPIAEGEIPEGCVFVYAPHSDSFDSRYQEFGLVQMELLKETLWPLF